MESDFPQFGANKKIAKALAKKLIKDAGITQAPVSLQRVIEHLQKSQALDVKKVPLGEKVSGLLVVVKEVDDEYATIGFNANHSWHRRRFTIAHEIGHLLLGHTCNQPSDNSHHETEAHTFAAELLMPTSLIKSDFQTTPDLSKLGTLYRVSSEALTIKLMDAKLV